ncbi:MAG: hypothetical protein EOO77_40475 [Oxalobacteraceae bacterium]|nr:MAG: hypothetical protein EOO77_40475 [Oxalobacteraceae bacterium]
MLNRLTRAFGHGPAEPPVYGIRIFMKSGNQIDLDRVIECTYKYTGDDITSFQVRQKPGAKSRLQVKSLNLNQIEAITMVA